MEPECCPKCEKIVYDAEGFPAGKDLRKKARQEIHGVPTSFGWKPWKKNQNHRNKNFEILVF